MHLNPVRAGACQHPTEYHWSSYRHYMDSRFAPAWLDWRSVLAEFHRTEAGARLAYRRFVEAGLADQSRTPLAEVTDGWLLGSDAFVARCRELDGRDAKSGVVRTLPQSVTLDEIITATSNVSGVSAARLCRRGEHGNDARQAAILVTRDVFSVPLSEVAARFGVGASAISEAVRVARHRADEDLSFRDLLAAIQGALKK